MRLQQLTLATSSRSEHKLRLMQNVKANKIQITIRKETEAQIIRLQRMAHTIMYIRTYLYVWLATPERSASALGSG